VKRLLAVSLAFLWLAVPPAEGQTKKVPVIGYLGIVEIQERDEAFRKGMREQGYVVGQDVRIEYRFAGGDGNALAALAAELVRLDVEVILASGTQALDAARQETKAVPIVFPITTAPVESGQVASLGRPGSNATGLSSLNTETAGKRLELLREVVPRLSSLAVLTNPGNPSSRVTNGQTQQAAKRLGIRLKILEVRNPGELPAALLAVSAEKAGALHVTPDNLLFSLRASTLEFAARNRIPTIFSSSETVNDGGLMSYGPNLSDMYRRAAGYVAKILRGARPGDLPVEQATRFEFVINLKTARRLGLTIPREVLFRADRVIE